MLVPVRSGVIGEPTSQDLAQQNGARRVLATLSRLSPAQLVYEITERHAQWSIERSRADGAFLDDE